jgi:hypothetical protein
MKNEYKILIAAIVVILILLGGAYALSGSKGPQATATPTAQPTSTPTPTPTPIASGTGGSTGGASNPAPTTAPTITPTPTIVPSPTPSSGVELTQFGYWITYPPLKPENWSIYTPPNSNGAGPTPTPTITPTNSGVQFISAGGYVGNRSYFDKSTMDVSSEFPGADNSPWWEVNITLTRTTTTGSLSPNIVISGYHNMPTENIYISQQPTFADGQATATVQVTFSLGSGSEVDHSYVNLSISPNTSYTIGPNNPFYLDTFEEW